MTTEAESHRRKIASSFLAVVAVATVVLGVLAWQINQTRDLTSQNKALVERVVRQAQTQEAACTNFQTLKIAVNDFHSTLRSLLTTAINTDVKRAKHIRDPKLKAADVSAVRQLTRLRGHIHTVTATCATGTGGQ